MAFVQVDTQRQKLTNFEHESVCKLELPILTLQSPTRYFQGSLQRRSFVLFWLFCPGTVTGHVNVSTLTFVSYCMCLCPERLTLTVYHRRRRLDRPFPSTNCPLCIAAD